MKPDKEPHAAREPRLATLVLYLLLANTQDKCILQLNTECL